MATENPIRMSGSNERWSNSRPVSVPIRSGSAPPSMEGSYLAVDNLLSKQGGSGYKLPSFQNHGVEEHMMAAHPYKQNLNRIPSPPIYYPTGYQFVDNRVARFSSNRGLNKVSSSHGALSTHKEVSEDESSQHHSVNSVLDRKNGFEIRVSPGSQGLADFRQDDNSSGQTTQHSRSNSSNGEMNTVDEGGNFSEISDDVMAKANTVSMTRASTGIDKNQDQSTIVSKMNNINISATTKYPLEARPERQLHRQQNNGISVQGAGKMSSHGVNNAVTGQFHYGHSADGQPVLQSSGFTPPLFYAATQTAYLNAPAHVYNMQSPTVYSPQYGYGPYSNMSPQFIPGYLSHGSVPFIVGPDYVPQLSGPSAGSVVHGGEMQYAEKLYVPPRQPTFPDPMYMQYCQPAFRPVDPSLVPRSHEYQKDDPKVLQQRSGPSNFRMGMTGVNYYGVQPNMGVMVQYLPTQLGTAPHSPGSVPYVDAYPGWQPQGSLEGGANGPRLCNFLEELKSGKGRRFDLSDITGHIVEFSADQHGSRFIQQKLEICSPEEKEAVFREVLTHACKLMTDVFGNYVIQKFFEYGNSAQRKDLADQLMGQIVPLSLQMYGCRVIQKALDVIELDQRVRLARELDGQVMRCVRDQNGNHVIQKCIENIPGDRIGFILSAFRGQVSSLSMHPYGCRVIQRLLERCSNEHQCRFITEEILESVCILSKDQYGNYVAQHVLEKGTSEERERIVRKLSGHIVQLSLHKFASNVIEKCLEYGGRIERDLIIEEIAGADESYDGLLMMMKDQYGNYVVQKIFETCTADQRGILYSRVKMHAAALKKYTYGKHIVTRLEQPFGEESKDLR